MSHVTIRSLWPQLALYPVLAGLFLTYSPLAAADFSDVHEGDYGYQAIKYLQEQGIVAGYEDGTFRPSQPVNRAEAMKFIVAPLTTSEQLAQYTTSNYTDVNAGDWFLPYVEHGRSKGFIDGPDKKPAFNPGNQVIKVEFLKMLLLANGVDTNSFSEIRLPLADDVTNVDEWYYPYLRYSLSASMVFINQNGMLEPGKQLNRADTAVLLYLFLMNKEGRRLSALLEIAEAELDYIVQYIEVNNITEAEYASARALLAARGAHASRPDHPTVQSALKITEGFRALVRAYRAGLNLDFNSVISISGDAWYLASRAVEISPNDEFIKTLSTYIQTRASGMADQAREIISNNS